MTNIYSIGKGLSKRLHIYFVFHARKILYRNKVKRNIKRLKCTPLTKDQISDAKNYFASFGFKNINVNWHRLYTHLSGDFHKEYIPEDIYYNTIEPNLNMISAVHALTDKNLLYKLFPNVQQPKTIIRNVNGFYYDGIENNLIQINEVIDKCNKYNKLIVKPSINSFGGKNIIVFKILGNRTDYNNMTIETILHKYGKNFIIQEFLNQHKELNLLNSSSVNTLRIKSLIINDKVEILGSIIRIGRKGSFVDNTSRGGVYCKIESGGLLNNRVFSIEGLCEFETESKVNIKDFQIPNFDRTLEDVKELHELIPYFRLISWDIALDLNGDTIFIEYNVEGQGIAPQSAYGPLFGEFSEQILRNCKN